MNVSFFLPILLPIDTQPLIMCAVTYSTARIILRRVFCSVCARISLGYIPRVKNGSRFCRSEVFTS